MKRRLIWPFACVLLMLTVVPANAQATNHWQTWNALSSWLNGFDAQANERHWFLFFFGTVTADAIHQSELREVSRACRTEKPDDYVVRTTLTNLDFGSNSVPEITRSIRLAISDDQDPAFAATLKSKSEELAQFLVGVASRARQVEYISSNGNCWGYWAHEHWVVTTTLGERYSISLGGGD